MATLMISQVDACRILIAKTHNPSSAQLRDIFPGQRPGGGDLTWSINRSSSPGGNTRTFILGRQGQTDIGPDRVMPLTEYVIATILTVN